MVERLFFAVSRGCLRFVIVVFPDHTHLLFLVFSSIHDTLTDISKQVHLNDKTTQESIQNVTVETSKVKGTRDQISCQILNKTTIILDKVKKTSEKITSCENAKSSPVPITNIAMNNQKPSEVPKYSDKQPNEKHQNPKPKQIKTLSAQHQNHEELSIDLTQENCDTVSTGYFKMQVIKQTALLIGCSLLKYVKVSDLKQSNKNFPNTTWKTVRP